MCCAFATLVLLGPRVLNALLWLFWPQFSLAFKNEFLVPLLGIIFLPWTTLMFVLVWTPVGLTPFAWFMVGFGFFFDIMSWLGGGWGNRRRVPGYDDMGLEPAMAPSASSGYSSPVAPAAPAAPAPAAKPPSTTPPSSAPPAPKPPAPPPASPPPATPAKPS